jgi:hypothetical protein
LPIHEYNAPAVPYAPVPIVKPINRSIKLIVTPDGHHQQLSRLQLMIGKRVNRKRRFA